MSPYTRCAVCGIPKRMLDLMIRKNMPQPEPKGKRLTVDHIEAGGPSVLGNTRVLCMACNNRKGANQRSDWEVWNWITWQWRRYYTDADLWWLHTIGPGEGGAAKRGKRHNADS